MPRNVKRILREFATIKPTAPADCTRKTFRTKWIHENTTNDLFDCSSCSFVATERRNASDVPNAKSWNENLKLLVTRYKIRALEIVVSPKNL